VDFLANMVYFLDIVADFADFDIVAGVVVVVVTKIVTIVHFANRFVESHLAGLTKHPVDLTRDLLVVLAFVVVVAVDLSNYFDFDFDLGFAMLPMLLDFPDFAMRLDLIGYFVERMNLPNPIQVMFQLEDYYLAELYQYSNQFAHQDFR
jgi:hypothetical protein